MDCFNNTCLSCDRECEGHYCSPGCKLADHERATMSSSKSSLPSTSPTSYRSRTWQTPKRQASYILEPAYDFLASTAKTQLPAATPQRPTLQTSHLVWNPSMHSSPPRDTSPIERCLSPSSSRSSLSSTGTMSSSQGTISASDNVQLQDYFSSFEKARAARRRSTVAR